MIIFRSALLFAFLLGPMAPDGACADEPRDHQAEAEALLADLPAFMERGMDDWGIPGMAVAVVRDGELVYSRGFGLRKLGADEPVDAHTIFGMASLTKAMTAAAIGMLADEGKLNWDDPVRDHLPWFTLSDPWVTAHVTIRDLLSHQVGIGRLTGNRLRFMPGRDPQTIMQFVSHMPLEQDFRSGYVYSNVMYMVAGQVVEAASGMSWDTFMQERIFEPLDMKRASTSITQITDTCNAAWPHQEIRGEVQVIERRNFDNVGPSASVNASVHDMAQWMLLQLGQPGKSGDQRLISEENILETHQPQQVFRSDDPLTAPLTGYGLGWGLRYYEGYRISQHTGATDGMTSLLAILPEKDLGVLVASNLFCNFRPAVRNYILDTLLGIDRERDWHAHYYDAYLEEKEDALEQRAAIHDARQPNTSTTLNPEDYTGQYFHDVYDDARVFPGDDGQLVMQLWEDDEMIADLEHWHHDTFRAHWRNPAMREKFVTFQLNALGEVSELHVNFTLRQIRISAGIYPAEYYRIVKYDKK